MLLGLQDEKFGIQNMLLRDQNDRIKLQNNLLEADRRSSLVFLMSNILDKMDDEIKINLMRTKNAINRGEFSPDSIPERLRYKLSDALIGRIIALSRAFQPYQMMQSDTLSGQLVSPERGQLFISLMQNKLDSATQNTIVAAGDFSYAIIGKISIENAVLDEINLAFSSLKGANFRNVRISNGQFQYSDFSEPIKVSLLKNQESFLTNRRFS
ncbi:MAG: pentapeptide repeat-containing protein [Saprospiraceae bacterium]|nr:pentapeptide repeat-containing protein [Saprospiraceae bacterium]